MGQIEIGLTVGLASWLWVANLTKGGELFAFVRVFLGRILADQDGNLNGWRWLIWKPLFECSKCLSFWASLLYEIANFQLNIATLVVATAVGAVLDKWTKT